MHRVFISAFALFFAVNCFAESYESLDKRIVEAYNANPKNTQDVYIYAMQMLERARLDRSDDASDWEDKAQMLITVAAYSEMDRALDNKDYQEAYVWTMRGLSNGAARGDLGGVSIKQVYDILKDLSEKLSEDPSVKELKYGKTMVEILDYRKVRKSSDYLPRDKEDVAGRPEIKEKKYSVIEGPAQDQSGLLYVKVKYDFGTIIKIKYYVKRGWKNVDAPDAASDGPYYASWQECADANADVAKFKGAPKPVRKKSTETKVYYKPSKANEVKGETE